MTEFWQKFTVIKVEKKTSWYYDLYLNEEEISESGGLYSGLENQKTAEISAFSNHPHFNFELIAKEFKSFEVEINLEKTFSYYEGRKGTYGVEAIRRPLEETLKIANQEIENLKNELEAEREAAIDFPHVQFDFYTRSYPSEFEELEKAWKEVEKIIQAEGEVNKRSLQIARKNHFSEPRVRSIWEKIKKKEETKKLAENELNENDLDDEIGSPFELSDLVNFISSKLTAEVAELTEKLRQAEKKASTSDKGIREWEVISAELIDEFAEAKSQSEEIISKKNIVIDKVATALGQQKIKTRKLTKIKKVAALLVEKLRADLAESKEKFRTSQTEIEQLKNGKQDLANKLEKKRKAKKELYTKLREIENTQKEKEQELTTSQAKLTEAQKTIQGLEGEKSNWEQREKELVKKQNELLAEIELLKNPPLTSANKEKAKESIIVKEVIKEVIIKDLVSNQSVFNLSSQEKTKLNNLPLQEVENYHSQLIKSKFNNLENQLKQLGINNRERERERERRKPSSFDYWLLC